MRKLRDEAGTGHDYSRNLHADLSGSVVEYAGVPVGRGDEHLQSSRGVPEGRLEDDVPKFQRQDPIGAWLVKASARRDWPSAVFLGGPVIVVLASIALFS